MLNKCYGEDDLESFSGVLNIVTTGWQNLPALCLREAAKLCNPKNDFNTGRCKCKTSCKDRRCACRQKGAQCSTKCHNGSSCQNLPHYHLLIRKRQRQPSLIFNIKEMQDGIETDEVTTSSSLGVNGEKKDSPICIEDTTTDKATTPWSSSLCLTFNDKIILESESWLSDRHINVAHKNYLKLCSRSTRHFDQRSSGRQWQQMESRLFMKITTIGSASQP